MFQYHQSYFYVPFNPGQKKLYTMVEGLHNIIAHYYG